jgi:hypothetical protein
MLPCSFHVAPAAAATTSAGGASDDNLRILCLRITAKDQKHHADVDRLAGRVKYSNTLGGAMYPGGMLSYRRHVIAILAGVGCALALATSAFAGGSSQQIYRDYAKDGKINGHYTVAQLQAALHDSTAQGYSPQFPSAVRQQIASHGVLAASANTPKRGTLPFTGLDIGLVAGGAVLLLLLGFGLRKVGRAT